MITVMGATGHTGGEVVRAALAAGERVRGLGRDARKLALLSEQGVDARAGDVTDAAFLADAFRGVDAVYVLTAPDPAASDYRAEQDRHGRAVAEALARSGVRHVVALSSLGADQTDRTGLLLGLRAQEERLRALAGVDLLLLRPGSFYENFEVALGPIAAHGVHVDALEPSVALPMIGARDVGGVAARALLSRGFRGHRIHELPGPRDLTLEEATRILGSSLGRPDLRYVQLPPAELVGVLVSAGLSESFAASYVEMTRAFDEGRVGPHRERGPEDLAQTPFEAYAAELVAASTGGAQRVGADTVVPG